MVKHSLFGFEDPVDSWTHLLGALSVCALIIILFRKGRIGRRYPIPILIYGFSCIFLFSMSGTYHMLPRDISARYVLRILDHAGIFLLIAGTLIAVHFIVFSGLMKWGVIIMASLVAVIGITFGSIYFDEIPEYITHLVFLVFGWLGVVSIVGLWKLKKMVPAKYLLYGGFAYTIGAIIDLAQYPVLIPGFFEAHEIFHLAVLIGVTFHWLLIIEAIRIVDNKS
jgi:channel protein (hemolysin III family)